QTAINAPGPLNYTIRLRNLGNIALTGVTLDDTLDGTDITPTGPTSNMNADDVLEVAEVWTYTYAQTVGQARFDTDTDIVNRVSATAEKIEDPVTASATTTLQHSPGLSVVKSVDRSSVSAPGALAYTIAVTNS